MRPRVLGTPSTNSERQNLKGESGVRPRDLGTPSTKSEQQKLRGGCGVRPRDLGTPSTKFETQKVTGDCGVRPRGLETPSRKSEKQKLMSSRILHFQSQMIETSINAQVLMFKMTHHRSFYSPTFLTFVVQSHSIYEILDNSVCSP